MKVKQAHVFENTLETIMQMDNDEREMLLDIVQKRQIEVRRKEIAKDARKARKDFHAGKLKIMDADELIEKLNKNSKRVAS